MATYWIVCAVLSYFTQDAWSYGYGKGHRGLQNGMSEYNFYSGYRSMMMNTCRYGWCEVWVLMITHYTLIQISTLKISKLFTTFYSFCYELDSPML